MQVQKRDGTLQPVQFDKITERIKTFCDDLQIDPVSVAQQIVIRLKDKITTEQLDKLTCDYCASLALDNSDYLVLASRLAISNHHKKTPSTFREAMELLSQNVDKLGSKCSLISKDIIDNYNEEIETIIDYSRDFTIDFFGFKTLERAYLLRLQNGTIIERPQHLWMRVALGIHGTDFKHACETYNYLSRGYFTHATPTLFHAGTPRPQMSSCFLLGTEDSVEGIYDNIKQCAQISKWAGGIGVHISNIRCKDAYIRKTGGKANGVIPMLKIYNDTARFINQSGKRNGSFAMYIEPWHADIFSFLDAKKPHGSDEERARDLFYALWIPDLFMERVKNNGIWSLMCPDECPGLSDCYGEIFNELYVKYESAKQYKLQIPAVKLWEKIIESQIQTGTPYMLYKDSCNRKSNQKNLGTIKSSNLCVAPETLVLTDKGHIEIQTLENKKVSVWNGKCFSDVIIKQTSDNAELVTVKLSDGCELTCTKYHKFYIQMKYQSSGMKQDIINSKSVEMIEAQNLKSGMKLIKCEYPVIDNKNILKNAYTNGFFSGDGTYSNICKQQEKKCCYKSLKGKAYCKRHISYQMNNENSKYCCGISYTKKAHVTLYCEKIKLLKYLNYRSIGKEKNKKLNVTLPIDLEEKFFVPMDYSLSSKLEWFSGYCDADGSIGKNGANQALQISCIHEEFLLKIKLMLQTCGIASKVSPSRKESYSYLPDGKGGNKYYKTKKLWRLLIGSNDLQKLLSLGFSPKRLIIKKHSPQRNATQFVKVCNIIDNNRRDKTFCFNETLRHTGIFNGVITSQCAEIIEYSDSKEHAVCNLASIALPKFLNFKSLDDTDIIIYTKSDCKFCTMAKTYLSQFKLASYKEVVYDDPKVRGVFYKRLGNEYDTFIETMPQIVRNGILIGGFDELIDYMRPDFDFDELHNVAQIVTFNLNKIIDKNFYPTLESKSSNLNHRPIGIGIQGLADLLQQMHLSFDCKDTKLLHSKIFETIYHGALTASLKLAKINGPYKSWKGCPLSKGKFQFDLWKGVTTLTLDWDTLRKDIIDHGIYNSLLLAAMPTASTAQILGNNESFEPYTSNIYIRRVLAGEYTIINKQLLNDLKQFGLWNKSVKEKLLYFRGSIQNIPEIPRFLKYIYKTAWELSQKLMIQLSADRGRFIDQSQSFNVFVNDVNSKLLTQIHFYGWGKGLKTGTYYIRSRSVLQSQKFTIDPKKEGEMGGACEMCSG